MASCAIGGRYAERRLVGPDETGDRRPEPKYTAETGKRILALLDQPPPEGHARWSDHVENSAHRGASQDRSATSLDWRSGPGTHKVQWRVLE